MYNKYTSFLPGSRALLSFPWTRPARLWLKRKNKIPDAFVLDSTALQAKAHATTWNRPVHLWLKGQRQFLTTKNTKKEMGKRHHWRRGLETTPIGRHTRECGYPE
jgi:hypothetical protein